MSVQGPLISGQDEVVFTAETRRHRLPLVEQLAEQYRRLNGIRPIILTAGNCDFSALPTPHWVKAFLWDLVEPDVERVTWIDSDTICIRRLPAWPEAPFAAAGDLPDTLEAERNHPELSALREYFNSGVFSCRRQSRPAFEALKRAMRNRLPLGDFWEQGAFNLAVAKELGGFHALPQTCNWFRPYLGPAPPECCILHFPGAADDEGRDRIMREYLLPSTAPECATAGRRHEEAGRAEQAAHAYREALRLGGPNVDLLNRLAHMHTNLGQLSQAVARLEEVIRLQPASPVGYCNLGSTLKDQGRVPEAIQAVRKAATFAPGQLDIWHDYLLYLNYDDRLTPEEVFAEHRRWGRETMHRMMLPAPHENDPAPERPLRIGYVSPDFRRHITGTFIEPVLRCHDRKWFQTFCYAEVSRPDKSTKRMRGLADGWFFTNGRSDGEVARRIRKDRIDILVDLCGHMGGSRLGVFAHKAAPIQMTWLGYPNTTGLPTVEYRITDAVADPPGATESLHTERLLRLPEGFIAYQAPAGAPSVVPPPALQNGRVTFGCFNNFAKATSTTLRLWASILVAVPNSRLLIKTRAMADAPTRQGLADTMKGLGVSPDRLEMVPFADSYGDHLAAYGRVDIALDCFPYNGTATTCEALWMGVPLVSLTGRSHVSRVSASILAQVGLGHLAAETQEAAVGAAVELAGDIQGLRDLRLTMRDRLSTSSLMDMTGFVRRLEEAYRQAWQTRAATREQA